MAIPWKPRVDPSGGVKYDDGNVASHQNEGDLGVLKAQVDLFEQGFTICVPQTGHAPFDLAGYRNGEFLRVQVKYRKVDKYGKIDVKLSTCWTDMKGTHTVPIDKQAVDLYCVYCPDRDECYYLALNSFDSNATLRVRARQRTASERA